MNLYPIYVISKGRAKRPLTARALHRLGIPFSLVIEPQQAEEYKEHVPYAPQLILPFSNLGQGSIPARNWCWEHALQAGHKRHWILDDNIDGFYRLLNNKKINVLETKENPFIDVERFVDRYTNIALAGLQYDYFAPRKVKHKPVTFNTRIYSCILILNEVPIRWRGRYNEDTDLSLRVLKEGWTTALFYLYLAKKISTMTMRGGNTDELYLQNEKFDGRLEMAKSLQRQHPDVVKIVHKWGRWQHSVDYRPFKSNVLIRVNKKDISHAGNE